MCKCYVCNNGSYSVLGWQEEGGGGIRGGRGPEEDLWANLCYPSPVTFSPGICVHRVGGKGVFVDGKFNVTSSLTFFFVIKILIAFHNEVEVGGNSILFFYVTKDNWLNTNSFFPNFHNFISIFFFFFFFFFVITHPGHAETLWQKKWYTVN